MTIKRMLCATDFSPASRPALRLAQELARTLKAKLILFHAYERSVPIGDGGYLPSSVLQEMWSATQEAARRNLKRLALSPQGKGVRISMQLAEGRPQQQSSGPPRRSASISWSWALTGAPACDDC